MLRPPASLLSLAGRCCNHHAFMATEITTTLAAAYFVFWLSEAQLEVSGVLAVVAFGACSASIGVARFAFGFFRRRIDAPSPHLMAPFCGLLRAGLYVSKNIACISPKVIGSARHIWAMVRAVVRALLRGASLSSCAAAVHLSWFAVLWRFLCQLSYLLNTIIFLLSGVIVAEKLFRST